MPFVMTLKEAVYRNIKKVRVANKQGFHLIKECLVYDRDVFFVCNPRLCS